MGFCISNRLFEESVERGMLKFVIDMEGLKTISSYALSIILKLNDSIKGKQGIFKIICPEGNVCDVFNVLDIAAVIPLYSSEDELWKNTVP